VSDAYDALILGGGPAGATLAIRLVQAGWSVAVVERQAFPRRKVCGECIAATNLPLLDALGLGRAFAEVAGPPLRAVQLVAGTGTVTAVLPPAAGAHPWGRALGREHLDTLLLQRAAALGVHVWQPWTAKSLARDGDRHVCRLSDGSGRSADIAAPLLVRAHGSWEPEPPTGAHDRRMRRHRESDLFAFKRTLRGGTLAPGLLPVLAFDGGYGGMVVGEHDTTTLAFCIRRDVLRAQRRHLPGARAACAALAHVEAQCPAVRHALAGAEGVGPWLTVGPLRPGIRAPWRDDGSFAVGNAAGEAHPILGEGISMAMQSAWLLADVLTARQSGVRGAQLPGRGLAAAGRAYRRQWRRQFAARIRFAALCAHLAMRPLAGELLLPALRTWPGLLTQGARLAGKVRPLPSTPPAAHSTPRHEEATP
jgi:menaquinone-9 beta-reductase